MNKTLLCVFACLALCACGSKPASTAPTPPTTPSGPAAAVAVRSYPAVGVVKAINPKTPSIEILHENIEGLMEGMQMEFDVTDASMLNGLAVNDHVDFTLEDRAGIMRVTAIQKRPQ